MPAPPFPVIIPVITVPAATTPVDDVPPDSPSVTARVGGAVLPVGTLQEELIVSVKPAMDPVQVATGVVVCVIVSVVRFGLADELYCVIGSQTSSTPMSFINTRVMSTPAEVPGFVTPVVGTTVNPIGFELAALLKLLLLSRPAAGLGGVAKGFPRGAPLVDVVLNGAQPSPLLKHTSTGWTLM